MPELWNGPIVDAHHHFWDPSINDHPWLAPEANIPFRYGDYSAIKRRYFPDDYFADTGAVMDSFERFVRGMRPDPAVGGRLLLIGSEDPGARTLAARLGDWDGRLVTFGPGGDLEATQVERAPASTVFSLFG